MTTLFRSEVDASAGQGALWGCALAMAMFLFAAGVMFRDFTRPTFSEPLIAQVKTCGSAQC